MAQVRVSHILLMYTGSERSTVARTRSDAEAGIAALKAKLDAGADFAELATAHSDCPSASRGGDLGLFGRGQMVAAFEEAVYGLAVGAISDVVETPFGYHLILRTE